MERESAIRALEHISTKPEPAREERVGWPKISLVTPVLNSAAYIDQTIRSVVNQGYPNLEYFIVDGGSTDSTLEIIRKHERHLNWWDSRPDKGMYDALNRGFARSSGELMGWISATDMLLPGSLFVVGSVFRTFPEVEWITGVPTGFHRDGMAIPVSRLRRWSRIRFLAGANRYIQQESTFWRRSLWERAGGHMDASRRNASDFELWVRFFRHVRLYSVNALIGGYRFHADSLGLQDMEACHRVHNEVIEAELNSVPWGWPLKLFRSISGAMLRTPVLRTLWKETVMSALIRLRGPDWAPVIRYRHDKWVKSSRVFTRPPGQ